MFGDPGIFRPFIPTWQPLMWEVATQTPEQLLATSGEWLQAMAVVRAEDEEPERFQQVLAEVMRRLEAVNQKESVRWHDLMWFLMSWAIRRRPGAERANIVAAMTANVNDATIQQEVRNMASRLGQRWEDEVLARGVARGEELGMERGMERGQLRMARSMLRTASKQNSALCRRMSSSESKRWRTPSDFRRA